MTTLLLPDSPALSAHVAERLRDNEHLVAQALLADLMTPADCDPDCAKHLSGFLAALRSRPALNAPDALLQRMSDEELWSLTAAPTHEFSSTPAAVTHLAARLLTRGLTLSGHTIRYRIFPTRPLAKELQSAILSLARGDRLDDQQVDAIRNQQWLSDVNSDELTHIRRQHGATQAAATRREQTIDTAGSPRRARQRDRFIVAIESGDPDRLLSFNIPTMNAKRLHAALPSWRRAKPSILAYLAQVPDLPPKIHAEALNAWAAINQHPHQISAVSPQTFPDLTEQAFIAVLNRYCLAASALSAPPDDHELTNALFRITLSHPTAAAVLQDKLALLPWIPMLHALPSPPSPDTTPSPVLPQSDLDAQWIRLLAKHCITADTSLAATLCTLSAKWPTERLVALQSPLLSLAQDRLRCAIPKD